MTNLALWQQWHQGEISRQAMVEQLAPLQVQMETLLDWTARNAPGEKAVALACVQLVVRSSACVEGRNGHLARYHHGLHRLSKRRLKALTAIADYYARRADGTTAGARFFRQKHPDLFGWLLDRLDGPAQPRSSRLKAAA